MIFDKHLRLIVAAICAICYFYLFCFHLLFFPQFSEDLGWTTGKSIKNLKETQLSVIPQFCLISIASVFCELIRTWICTTL